MYTDGPEDDIPAWCAFEMKLVLGRDDEPSRSDGASATARALLIPMNVTEPVEKNSI